MKKLLILNLVLIAALLTGCTGDDAVARCVEANIKSDIESGKLKRADTAAVAQAESMHRAACMESMTQKAY